MKLRERTYKGSYRRLVQAALRVPFGMYEYNSASSFYDPHSFLLYAQMLQGSLYKTVSVTYEDHFEHLRAGLKKLRNFDEKLNFLIRETAWLHEVKHFHDCLCTVGGICEFLRQWLSLCEIFERLATLAISGRVLEGPLNQIAHFRKGGTSREMAAVSKEILDAYSTLLLYRFIMNGDSPPTPIIFPAEVADEELVWIEFADGPVEGLRIPHFPATIESNGIKKAVLLPIGLRALMEESAIDVQDAYIGSFGDQFLEAHHEWLRAYPEYLTLNCMLTRVLKNRGFKVHSTRQSEIKLRKELYRLIYATLSHRSGHNSKSTPGNTFVSLLTSRMEGDTCSFDFSRDETKKNIEEFRALVIAKAMDRITPIIVLDRIREFALKKCFIPAMNIFKRQTGGKVFALDTIDWYLWFGNKLPRPPFAIHGMEITRDLVQPRLQTVEFVINIIMWIMMRSSLEQAVMRNNLICPGMMREYESLFANEGIRLAIGCARDSSNTDCGRVHLGSVLKHQPNCAWKTCLTTFAMALP